MCPYGAAGRTATAAAEGAEEDAGQQQVLQPQQLGGESGATAGSGAATAAAAAVEDPERQQCSTSTPTTAPAAATTSAFGGFVPSPASLADALGQVNTLTQQAHYASGLGVSSSGGRRRLYDDLSLRLAAADALEQAERAAEMEGLRGALDGSGRLLGRLRADHRVL
eukprot:XP_001703136.1 predicted protein [Chlamydomonas reinhardtii]